MQLHFKPYHLRIFRLFVISFMMVTWWLADVGHAFEQSKSVLYINSYHHGYPWSDTIFEGIKDALAQSSFRIELQVEYMDAKKYNVQPVNVSLYHLHGKKFENERFDVIIVSDDDAFRYALKYRPELFPGVPIVFCGVNNLSSKDAGAGNVTGIVENFDLNGTVDVVLDLHPGKKKMIVVGDDSTAGQAIRSQIEAYANQFKDQLSVDYWVQVALEEVQERVTSLPPDTFLFFIPYYQESDDYYHAAEEVMAAIYAHSNVPIYTGWEFLLGHGAVGGSLLSGLEHGRTAANLALKILEGESAESIPIVYEPNGLYLFDYRVMERLEIDRSILPPESRIINAPSPFYQLPRELIWTIVVSFLLLIVVLMFLSFNMIARRRVERRIKDQLTFQEILIDTIPLLVSWKDIRGRYVGANAAFANFFGLGEIGEVVAKTTKDVVSDEEYVRWSVDTDQSVVNKNEEFRRVKKQLYDGDGTTSWLELSKVPLRDQDGKVTGVLTTAENITREQDLEIQLLQSQKMEAIGTLAGGIAHDFNNILTSIINSTELAITDVEPETQTSMDLERVLKAARRGSRVVKQILTFSRPTQEGFRATDLESLIQEVITLMEVSLPGSIKMKSTIKEDVEKIQADPTQLHQALMNLCTNAFHELREMGGEIHLDLDEVFLEEEDASYMNLESGSFVRIRVGDNGPGIKPEVLEKIFDPFFTSKDKTEGSGLGLTVVMGIVKNHNGAVRVKSDYGVGTTFELFLPKLTAYPEVKGIKPPQVRTHQGLIMFVEDDQDQLHTTPRILRSLGYRVDSFGDSREALEAVTSAPFRYDLVITDYDMPGMNGIDMVKNMCQNVPDLPVIMVSGREEAMSAAMHVGAIEHVFVKPYDKDELTAMISLILNRGVKSSEYNTYN